MYGFLADVHLSRKLKSYDYLNSLEIFLDHIRSQKEECDGIFILGDLFDHKLDIDELKLSGAFLCKLIYNNCSKTFKHAPCYFIHGTDSHDLNQYDIFLPAFMPENPHVYYTNKAGVMTTLAGHSVLLLPQEYNEDYTELLNKQYDLIVGHGVITSMTNSPCQSSHGDFIFPAEILEKRSKLCIFGHYHEYTDFGGNVFYAGSMLRTKYGEDTAKQFLFCDNNFNVHTLINPYALEFKTYKIDTPEQLRDMIAKGITTPHRFVLSVDSDTHDEFAAIISVNKNNPNITYKIDRSKNITSEEHTNTTTEEIIIDKSKSISNPIPELIEYINKKYDTDISDQINEYVREIEQKGDKSDGE